MKLRAEQIENRARMQEQKLKLGTQSGGKATSKDVEESQVVNDLYIDSI